MLICLSLAYQWLYEDIKTQEFPKKAKVVFKLKEPEYTAELIPKENRRFAQWIKKLFTKIPFVATIIQFMFEVVSSLLGFSSREKLKASIDKDISGLQAALKVLSNPVFKKAICGSVSDDLDVIFKKVVDIEIPTSIIAASGVIAIFGVSRQQVLL